MHSSPNRHHHPRGFTVVDLIVAVFLLGLVVLVLAIALPPMRGRARGGHGRAIKESTQIRGIHQAMVTWAGSNKELFPLPSKLDRMGATVAPAAASGLNPESASDPAGDPQRAKDTTANIMSVMIWNNMITPELLVSPQEGSSSIKVMEDYANTEPKAAVDPKNAKWDPALSADFTTGTGNISFAHLQPSGLLISPDPKHDGKPTGRLTQWRDTNDATTVVLSTRAPQIQSVKPSGPSATTAVFTNPASKTIEYFGKGREWRGNLVFNDNHVDTLTMASGATHKTESRYRTAAGKQLADCIFFDESDDPAQSNTYLGIFTKAGEKPGDFQAIWD
jgi:hypothetical protein